MTMLPSLQLRPISTSHYYVSGNVVIEAGVAIAPGALIQADPNTQVIIHAGVVIGSGAVIHANHGRLEIGAGTIIGAEVLLIGHIQIGEQVCIGAASTIFHRPVLLGKAALHIAAGEFIPPGSLWGDPSPRAEAVSAAPPTVAAPAAAPRAAPPGPTHGSATHPDAPGKATEAAQVHRPAGFAASATHGFVGVPSPSGGSPPSGWGGSSTQETPAYFQAPVVPQPDLPHQPFTETPPVPLGMPPPPTRVPPQPSYPQPYTLPKADISPPIAPPGGEAVRPDATAIQPLTNGVGTVNYVNQMLGRMFPHRQPPV